MSRTIIGLATATAVAVALLALASTAFGAATICTVGSAAGQCDRSQGVAIDPVAERLYVADERNNRIDVFDTVTGTFVEAFGWKVNPGGSNQLEVCTASCQRGSAGAGAGQLNAPTSISVDPVSHALYVAEPSNFRIQKFDPLAGPDDVDFLLMLGGGVDKTIPANVCTAASGHTCGAGASGIGEGEFSGSLASLIHVSVSPSGTLYVVDNPRTGAEQKDFVYHPRLQRFEANGTPIPPQHTLFSQLGAGAFGVAVNSVGDLWVTAFGEQPSAGTLQLRKFKADGTEIVGLPSPLPIAGQEAKAVTVDEDDNVFVSGVHGGRRDITEFDSAGNMQRRFGYGSLSESNGEEHGITGLAPRSDGTGIYVSQASGNPGEISGRVTSIDFPNPGPLIFPEPCKAGPIGSTSATLNAQVNPEGEETKYHFELVDDATFEASGFSSATRIPPSESDDPTLSADFELTKASLAASVEPETVYHCRAVATNSSGTMVGEQGEFETGPPFEFGAVFATDVGSETASLGASINPLGTPAEGHFEYVDDATYQVSGFAAAKRVPAGEISFGGDSSFVTRESDLSGLQPGTLYHYRVLISDQFVPGGWHCPQGDPTCPEFEPTFRTYLPAATLLPDSRAWELVSPGRKDGAEVGMPTIRGGLENPQKSLKIRAAAGSGEAVTYTSWTSFGPAQGAPPASQYLSRRTASGWGTENISPLGIMTNPLDLPYRAFSSDLAVAALVVSEPPLTTDAQPGFENLYLRHNSTGALRALTEDPIQFTPFNESTVLNMFCTAYAGASADGSRAFFAADGAMAGAPAGIGFSLYEWSATTGLSLVSRLPNGSPATPVSGTGFGALGRSSTDKGVGSCAIDQSIIADAISSDGSVAFWTYGGVYENGPETSDEPLMARLDGTSTVQLDKKEAGAAGPSGGGRFWAATPNGALAFFTAPGKLTTNSAAQGQLYRYDVGLGALANLTPGSTAPNIRGVVGASDDGTYVYFVAGGALTGSQENDAGQKATTGENNLYLWHEGEGLRFIALLADEDERDWSSAPEAMQARVTPSGHHLAFISLEATALSEYDNERLGGGPCQVNFPERENSLVGSSRCPQAYLYDAVADQLTCASCNPSRARPAGPTQMPGWSNPLAGPRFLSDDGSRLFFESRDALVPEDENGRRDVYEFERAGAGSCSGANPRFDPISGGCIFLISNGKSGDETYFVDASSSGRDVFFSTRSSLVGWDTNENYDVYDVREGGGFPEPPPPPLVCEGEACKPSITPAPGASSAPTSQFNGPGNPKPRPCKKGFVRKGGKCVKQRHKKKHHEKKHRAKKKQKGKQASGKGRSGR